MSSCSEVGGDGGGEGKSETPMNVELARREMEREDVAPSAVEDSASIRAASFTNRNVRRANPGMKKPASTGHDGFGCIAV